MAKTSNKKVPLTKGSRPRKIRTKKKEIKVLLDTSILIPLCDSSHHHHRDVWAAINFLRQYKDRIGLYVSHSAFFEFIEYFRKGYRLSPKMTLMKKFKPVLTKIGPPIRWGGTPLTIDSVIEKYDEYPRKRKVKHVELNDFIILTEGKQLKAKILTCDFEMYQIGQYLKTNVYFISNRSKKAKSQLAKFVQDIQEDVRKE